MPTLQCLLFVSLVNIEKPCGSWWLRGESVCPQCGRPRFDPWVGKIPGEGNGNPLQYSCLGHPANRGAWRLQSTGVAKELDTRYRLNHKLTELDKLLDFSEA